MPTQLVHVGFGNILAMNRVVALVAPHAAPIKRLLHEGKAQGMVLDLTSGRRTKTVLLLDDGHIALVALAAETLLNRMRPAPPGDQGGDGE
jgi:regulator of extracellular matrix RemA (YlzA/DUF370 family)